METSGDSQFCPLVFRGVMECQAEIEDAVNMAPVARKIGSDGIPPGGKDLFDQVVLCDSNGNVPLFRPCFWNSGPLFLSVEALTINNFESQVARIATHQKCRHPTLKVPMNGSYIRQYKFR